MIKRTLSLQGSALSLESRGIPSPEVFLCNRLLLGTNSTSGHPGGLWWTTGLRTEQLPRNSEAGGSAEQGSPLRWLRWTEGNSDPGARPRLTKLHCAASLRASQVAPARKPDRRGGDLGSLLLAKLRKPSCTCVFLASLAWPALSGPTVYFVPLRAAWAGEAGEGKGDRAPFLRVAICLF